MQAYFVLLFVAPLLLIKSIIDNPGFNVSEEYPKGYSITLTLANSLFLALTVYIFICSFFMCRGWKSRPVRHKTFFIMTASFYIIFLISRSTS